MAEVKLYQGSKDNYDANEPHNGIYFITDKKEIWLNGLPYSHDLKWDKPLSYKFVNGDGITTLRIDGIEYTINPERN